MSFMAMTETIASHYLLANVLLRFGSKFYRQIVGKWDIVDQWVLIVLLLLQICFFICYERNFMLYLSGNYQAEAIVETLNSTLRYIDELLNICNTCFEIIESNKHKHPTERQLNKAHSFDTDAFLNLGVYITNGIVSSKINNKRDYINFEIFNFPFLDRDVLISIFYGVHTSQLICFARVY